MRQFNLVFTVLVMFFALQGQAQNKKASNKDKDQMTLSLKKASTSSKKISRPLPTTVALASRAPTANVGSTNCAAKNKAQSPFSKEGKLTQVNRPIMATNQRSATGNL